MIGLHDFLSFYIVVSKCEEWREEAFFVVGSGRQLTAESQAKFLKLDLSRVSKFGWTKQLVTNLLFGIQSSAFFFLNL